MGVLSPYPFPSSPTHGDPPSTLPWPMELNLIGYAELKQCTKIIIKLNTISTIKYGQYSFKYRIDYHA